MGINKENPFLPICNMHYPVQIGNFEKVLELSRGGLEVLVYVALECLTNNTKYVQFSTYECAKWLVKNGEVNSAAKAKARKGLKDLLDSKILARTGVTNKYWIDLGVINK